MTPPVALTVAGTDSGGAAGIAADLATFAALGVHGACVVTAVTAQDTTGVRDVHAVPVTTIAAQLDAVLDDLPVAALKTGMLGSAEVVVRLSVAYGSLPAGRRVPLVVDPVLVATSGAVLGDGAVRDAYVEHLLPVATVVTPNLDEARALAEAAGLDPRGAPPDLAAVLATLGPAVVLTGGGEPEVSRLGRGRPRTSTTGTCTDWLAVAGADPVPLTHPAVTTGNDHGTGCTFSAAMAALLACRDDANRPLTAGSLRRTALAAADFTTRQLELSRTWDLGRGRGPVAHLTTAHTTAHTTGGTHR